MGNVQAPAGAPRHNRRREMTLLFYFVFGFVLIRVWILLIESGSVVVESIGGVITFLLFVSLYLRYRMQRQQQAEFEINRNNQDVNNPDLALLQALFRTPRRGVSQEIINSLYCFSYSTTGEHNEQVHLKQNDTCATSTCSENCSANDQPGQIMVNLAGDIENNTQTDVESDVGCCSICLAEYVQDERLIMLPCRHVYHRTCVTEWLLGHTQCPLCKQDVLELLDQQLYVQTQIQRLREASQDREENAALANILQTIHGPHYVYGAGNDGYSPSAESAPTSVLEMQAGVTQPSGPASPTITPLPSAATADVTATDQI